MAADDTARPDDKAGRPSAVRATVDAALDRLRSQLAMPGLSIAELERMHGLTKGKVATPLKPVNRGGRPHRETIHMLARVLNVDVQKLADAFWADYMGDSDPKTIYQQRAADLIAELPTHLQDLSVRQLEVLVEHHRTRPVTPPPCTDGPAT